ncbi:MAG TPA: NAD(P)-dependent alcohol dehydrogenase [Clostridia bacterium]|nr:NAD(P)-dependent alcohol dehydrogenase [Clostridia bacterium]
MNGVVYDKTSPDHLSYCDVEKPVPGDGEVLIRVHTTSLNAADYRLFKMGLGIPKTGIFGADVAGTVESVGKNVLTFKPGDDVVADTSGCGFGGMAEYARASQDTAVRKPTGVSFEDAAASPMASVTALQALRDIGRVREGQKVLIHGASGGVGTFAVQLAKCYGADVTAVCSTGNVQRIRDLGADHVIDYKIEDFTRNGIRYDLIVAINGYHPLSAYKRSLTSAGTYVMIGGTFPQIAQSLLFGPMMSLGTRKMRSLAAKANSKDLAFIMELLQERKLHPVIDRTFPLAEGAAAFLYIASGHAFGKVLIRVAGET